MVLNSLRAARTRRKGDGAHARRGSSGERGKGRTGPAGAHSAGLHHCQQKALHAHLSLSLFPAYRTPQSDEIEVSLCLGSVVFTIISNDEVGICVLL